MRWDYKLVYYLLLTYFMYGLFNWFYLGDFITPLPLSFVFGLIIPIAFLLKTKLTLYSILFLTIPLLLFKDLIIYYNENIGAIFIIVSLTSFVVLGLILLKRYTQNKLILINSLLIMLSPILLIGNNNLSTVYITLTAFITFKSLQLDIIKDLVLERTLLISFFIQTLFLLNETSNWLVAL